jgi:CRISPR/Cas system type I-B associated protein Csh2 (Cas7 group RAMP superfamily)
MQDTLQSIKKSGNLNPMWGKRHDEETKKKISDAQKKRYAAIRKALKENDILDYAQTNDAARKDVLKQLLDRNELNFKNVQQAVNFIAIMLNKDRIQKIIKEEINDFINGCDKGSI